MTQEKNRLKEPGIGRLLLSALALGCAILVGFVLGLRAGDKSRKQPPVANVAVIPFPDTTISAPDTLTTSVSDTLEVHEVPEPAPVSAPAFSKQEIALGVEYLASHNRWNRDEMEAIPSLAGLWDAVNTYQIEDLRRFNESLSSTPLTSIVEGLEQKPKKGYYAAKADRVITLSTYIKRLR